MRPGPGQGADERPSPTRRAFNRPSRAPGQGADERGRRLAEHRAVRKALEVRTSPRRFRQLVGEALDTLPDFVQERMDNVAVVVEEWPSPSGDDEEERLLGLYEGIARGERGTGYHLAVPDRITIFRGPILEETAGAGVRAVVEEVRKTVVHEVAHYLGMDDEELVRLEAGRDGGRWTSTS